MAEVTQTAHVTELERVNAELRVELEQARLRIVEDEESQSSLRSGYERLGIECESLHNAAETLKQEKSEAEKSCETKVVALSTRFQDCCVHHRLKLSDLRFSLEKAVSEFGASCLPYPGKGSTIREIVQWFEEEIKANKNIVCYAIISVLRMLNDSEYKHLEGLQSIMAGCDASILKDLLPELAKLTGRIVRRWWMEHGLPEAASRFHREPEVSMCYDALAFYVDVHLTCILLVC